MLFCSNGATTESTQNKQGQNKTLGELLWKLLILALQTNITPIKMSKICCFLLRMSKGGASSLMLKRAGSRRELQELREAFKVKKEKE